MATETQRTWVLQVCPACDCAIRDAGHFCTVDRKWTYTDGETVEVVPARAFVEAAAEALDFRAALERIRCEVLDTEGAKAVRIADEALTPPAESDSDG